MNGLNDVTELSSLKVNGISKLYKEIREVRNIENKFHDALAQHRNEQTNEIEGMSIVPKTTSMIGVPMNVDSTQFSEISPRSLNKMQSNINYTAHKVDETLVSHLSSRQLY